MQPRFMTWLGAPVIAALAGAILYLCHIMTSFERFNVYRYLYYWEVMDRWRGLKETIETHHL